MQIRPATADDVPHILPMVQGLADLHESWDPERFDYIPEVGRRYERWLTQRARDARSVFLVAERPADASGLATPIGFVVATIEPTIPVYRVKETGFVHDLWVDERYRHEGIGRNLVMRLIERFAEIGVSQIRLETAVANEPARQLFASCGFRTSAVEMLLNLKAAT
ncbi:MAG TPA: GNAT family N-acetyltransferase [Tepidisphaeraceae bacterium]|nr:GNAT family N-acetyltransferase [Tepidisphaeraceae bacterium]